MKKIIFVLPLCVFFVFCSSSRKAATPAAPGISNVNVSRNDTMTSAANASSAFTAAERDWEYTSKRDTALNGTWLLEGIAANDGSWSDTKTANTDSSTMVTDTAIMVNNNMSTADEANSGNVKMGKRGKGKSKNNRKALYDSAQTRLSNMDYKTSTALDTATQPFKYWMRVPSVTFNANNLIFRGNTGCNSMSGSFNFSDKNIQFGRNIVTSKMSCNDYNENNFLSALKKADNYTLNGNTLELKQGSTKLLSFRKA